MADKRSSQFSSHSAMVKELQQRTEGGSSMTKTRTSVSSVSYSTTSTQGQTWPRFIRLWRSMPRSNQPLAKHPPALRAAVTWIWTSPATSAYCWTTAPLYTSCRFDRENGDQIHELAVPSQETRPNRHLAIRKRNDPNRPKRHRPPMEPKGNPLTSGRDPAG